MAVYLTIRDGLFDRYCPVGLVEEFWTDRVAAEMLRSLRLVGHEQESFRTLQFIATAIPIDTILRCRPPTRDNFNSRSTNSRGPKSCENHCLLMKLGKTSVNFRA